MRHYPIVLFLTGALTVTVLAMASAVARGPGVVAALEQRAAAVLADSGVSARFRTGQGWLTRHPFLSGGESRTGVERGQLAGRVAALPGIGGVRWTGTGPRQLGRDEPAVPVNRMHCQDDVEGVLKTRTLRFAEASAAIDPASEALLDEVAAALRPCQGGQIAVLGHTDAQGDERTNVVLSYQRAMAVRTALIARGIPGSGLRARGLGSAKPVEGLDPADPANRRIEFSVIAPVRVRPTPVDTPGPG